MPLTFKTETPNLHQETAGAGGDTELAPANDKRMSIRIANASAGVGFYGPPGVTAATGIPIPAGESIVEREWRGAINVITASGTVDFRAIEFREDA